MSMLRKANSLARTSWPSTQPWNRLFGNDFLDLWDGGNIETVPSINIKDEKDRYVVEMAAPGMTKEDFNIDLSGNMLTISCEKETETKGDGDSESNGRYSRREYNYSSFSRSFTLPESADTQKIDATYKDGILCLKVAKKPDDGKNKSQRITVK
jgi:HSP20 family protein